MFNIAHNLMHTTENNCVQQKSFRNTDTTKWTGKHIPSSVSISSNVVEQQILLCKAEPQ